MLSTTTYRQGDIVLVSFPFTDLTATKKRPALVISPNSINQQNQDLILAAITSQRTEDEHGLLAGIRNYYRLIGEMNVVSLRIARLIGIGAAVAR